MPCGSGVARSSIHSGPSSLDGATHFLTNGLQCMQTEMCLHVLVYSVKRLIFLLGACFNLTLYYAPPFRDRAL